MHKVIVELFKFFIEVGHCLFVVALILIPMLYLISPSVQFFLRGWGVDGGLSLFLFLVILSITWILVFGTLSIFISINDNLNDIKRLLQSEARYEIVDASETALVMSDRVLEKQDASYKEPYFKK